MIAPFRGRRRSRGRRSRRWPAARRRSSPSATRPAIANVIASRWSSRLSTVAPRRARPAVIRRSSPSTSTSRAERGEARRDAGDPVGLLVAQLAGAADAASCRRRGRRRGTGPGSRRSRRRRRAGPRSMAWSRLERIVMSAIGSPPSTAGPSGRSTTSLMSAPIEPRMSMTARRVGLTPTPRRVSSASGWIAPATSQNAAAETSPGTRSLTASTVDPPSRLIAAPPPGPSATVSTLTPRARSIRSV